MFNWKEMRYFIRDTHHHLLKQERVAERACSSARRVSRRERRMNDTKEVLFWWANASRSRLKSKTEYKLRSILKLSPRIALRIWYKFLKLTYFQVKIIARPRWSQPCLRCPANKNRSKHQVESTKKLTQRARIHQRRNSRATCWLLWCHEEAAPSRRIQVPAGNLNATMRIPWLCLQVILKTKSNHCLVGHPTRDLPKWLNESFHTSSKEDIHSARNLRAKRSRWQSWRRGASLPRSQNWKRALSDWQNRSKSIQMLKVWAKEQALCWIRLKEEERKSKMKEMIQRSRKRRSICQ